MPDIPSGVRIRDLSTFAGRMGAAMDVLLGRDFNPGVPLAPRAQPDSQEQTQGPRQYQYPVAINTFPLPRRETSWLTPFEQLRNLAAQYDVAAMCIAARIEELQGMAWSIAAKDKRQQADLQDECDVVTAFFEQPDKLNDFSAWLGMLLYDLFTIDALTLYKRPDEGGKLYALEAVDGSTIKPLLDDRGRTLAYQQVLYGYPFSEYKRPDTEAPDEQMPTFGVHELLYKPRWTRTFTAYGFPPTEWIILRVNTALRKQTFDLAWFTDGNVPEGFATPPDGVSLTPDQVQKFEDWFNATLEGNDQARRKIRFLPWNMNFNPLKELKYDTVLDEWMLRVTCAAYSVPPQELGFTYDVNKATAEMQEAINERKGLKPLATWLKTSIFDPIIRKDLAQARGTKPDQTISFPGKPTRAVASPFSQLEWQWHFGDKEDTLVQAQADQVYLTTGVVTPDEIRTMRYGDVLDGPAPGVQPSYSPSSPFGMATDGQESDAILPAAARSELKQWMGKSLKALKDGKSADVSFVSAVIPQETLMKVHAGLKTAQRPDQVRMVFEHLDAAPGVAADSFFRQGGERYP